jgi:serine/threonine protein kinase
MSAFVCPSCGAQVAARVGRGLCPSCLLGLALLEPEEGEAPPGADESLRSASMLAVLDGGADRTVYLAERPDTRQLLVIEVIRADGFPPTTAGTFAARVEDLRRLSHPGLASVLGGWATAGGYCVASEYLPGASLERYCAAKHVDAAERLALFLAASDALKAAHAAGVLHGRLGPASIVVTRRAGETRPAVTGFGLPVRAPATPATDLVALIEILERLMADQSEPRAESARRVAGAARSGEIASVADLIAALQKC